MPVGAELRAAERHAWRRSSRWRRDEIQTLKEGCRLRHPLRTVSGLCPGWDRTPGNWPSPARAYFRGAVDLTALAKAAGCAPPHRGPGGSVGGRPHPYRSGEPAGVAGPGRRVLAGLPTDRRLVTTRSRLLRVDLLDVENRLITEPTASSSTPVAEDSCRKRRREEPCARASTSSASPCDYTTRPRGSPPPRALTRAPHPASVSTS